MPELKPKLIVLIDFSSYSKDLLKVAEAWGKVLKAEIVLVHQPAVSVPAMTNAEARVEIIQSYTNEALQKLKTLAEENMQDATRINFFVDPEPLVNSLQKLLKQKYYHIIFAGLKGTGFLKKIFIGSTITEIIDKLEVPVVAVPKGEHLFPSKLFFGTSYHFPVNNNEFIKLLTCLQGRLETVKFLTVAKSDKEEISAKEYLNLLEGKYKSTDYKVSTEVVSGEDSFLEIKKFMFKQKEGIFVVQKGARTLSDLTFRKFLINELIYEGGFPLLILP